MGRDVAERSRDRVVVGGGTFQGTTGPQPESSNVTPAGAGDGLRIGLGRGAERTGAGGGAARGGGGAALEIGAGGAARETGARGAGRETGARGGVRGRPLGTAAWGGCCPPATGGAGEPGETTGAGAGEVGGDRSSGIRAARASPRTSPEPTSCRTGVGPRLCARVVGAARRLVAWATPKSTRKDAAHASAISRPARRRIIGRGTTSVWIRAGRGRGRAGRAAGAYGSGSACTFLSGRTGSRAPRSCSRRGNSARGGGSGHHLATAPWPAAYAPGSHVRGSARGSWPCAARGRKGSEPARRRC